MKDISPERVYFLALFFPLGAVVLVGIMGGLVVVARRNAYRRAGKVLEEIHLGQVGGWTFPREPKRSRLAITFLIFFLIASSVLVVLQEDPWQRTKLVLQAWALAVMYYSRGFFTNPSRLEVCEHGLVSGQVNFAPWETILRCDWDPAEPDRLVLRFRGHYRFDLHLDPSDAQRLANRIGRQLSERDSREVSDDAKQTVSV